MGASPVLTCLPPAQTPTPRHSPQGGREVTQHPHSGSWEPRGGTVLRGTSNPAGRAHVGHWTPQLQGGSCGEAPPPQTDAEASGRTRRPQYTWVPIPRPWHHPWSGVPCPHLPQPCPGHGHPQITLPGQHAVPHYVRQRVKEHCPFPRKPGSAGHRHHLAPALFEAPRQWPSKPPEKDAAWLEATAPSALSGPPKSSDSALSPPW